MAGVVPGAYCGCGCGQPGHMVAFQQSAKWWDMWDGVSNLSTSASSGEASVAPPAGAETPGAKVRGGAQHLVSADGRP